MDHMQKSAKDQLTSELITHTVRRAKEAGINMSAIINQLQGSLSDQGNVGNTPKDLLKAYKKLFREMKHIIQPYDVIVEIGSAFDPENGNNRIPIELTRCGPILSGRGSSYIRFGAIVDCLYEPMRVLHNLISELTKVAEANKHKIKVLEAALRSVKVMSEDMNNDGLSRSEVSE